MIDIILKTFIINFGINALFDNVLKNFKIFPILSIGKTITAIPKMGIIEGISGKKLAFMTGVILNIVTITTDTKYKVLLLKPAYIHFTDGTIHKHSEEVCFFTDYTFR